MVIARFESAGRTAVCQVSGQGGASALILQDFPPAEGDAHEHPVVLLDQPGVHATLTKEGLRLAQNKVAALPADWNAGIMKGSEAFGICVMKATQWEASVRLIGEDAAQKPETPERDLLK